MSEPMTILGYGRDHLDGEDKPIFGALTDHGGFSLDTIYKYIVFSDELIQWVRQHDSSSVPPGETIQ